MPENIHVELFRSNWRAHQCRFVSFIALDDFCALSDGQYSRFLLGW